jgi:Na+/melibiose symporter-like transporter
MRLKSTKLVMFIIPPSVLAFAWVTGEKLHWAGAVATLFVSGFGILFIYASTLAYIVDANAGRSTAAVAANSSFRGIAGLVAAEIAAPLQDTIGDGGLYSLWAGLLVVMELMILVVIRRGQHWREEAEKRERKHLES